MILFLSSIAIAIPQYEMILIPAGSVTTQEGSFQDTSRTLTLSAFYIGKTEVTQELWSALMDDNPSYFVERGAKKPVEQVTWHQAIAFANRMSKREGLQPCYRYENVVRSSTVVIVWEDVCNGYRLPTEAEWVYAAQGGNPSYEYSGGNFLPEKGVPGLDDIAWHYGNSKGQTHAVCTKKPNGYGLCDMSGNVSEWLWDLYYAWQRPDKRGFYRNTWTNGLDREPNLLFFDGDKNPRGYKKGLFFNTGNPEARLSRGGSIWTGPGGGFLRHLRVNDRHATLATETRCYYMTIYQFSCLGFRLARSAP